MQKCIIFLILGTKLLFTLCTCKRAQCECDKNLAERMASAWSDDYWESTYWWNAANLGNRMDPNSCTNPDGNGGFGTAANACCGDEYPYRFPYYNGGDLSCCSKSGKIYDPAVMQCCSDGSVQIVC